MTPEVDPNRADACFGERKLDVVLLEGMKQVVDSGDVRSRVGVENDSIIHVHTNVPNTLSDVIIEELESIGTTRVGIMLGLGSGSST